MDNNLNEKINEIRQQADIVDIVSRHINVFPLTNTSVSGEFTYFAISDFSINLPENATTLPFKSVIGKINLLENLSFNCPSCSIAIPER